LPPHASVIDLGCGKGRHSVSLHELGFNVLGIDLSKESISTAKEKSTNGLRFEVQDMRQFTVEKPVDCVMNLFTSFGYFDNETDNSLVIQRVREALVPGGYFVIDYFNSEMVQQCHGDSKNITIQDIQFTMHKRIENNRVIKKIDVNDRGTHLHFEEKVQLFKMDQLSQMLIAQDLEPIATFGDYKLNPFEASTSDRLIIIAKK
jgi:SAM-dependent methyltransferase